MTENKATGSATHALKWLGDDFCAGDELADVTIRVKSKYGFEYLTVAEAFSRSNEFDSYSWKRITQGKACHEEQKARQCVEPMNH